MNFFISKKLSQNISHFRSFTIASSILFSLLITPVSAFANEWPVFKSDPAHTGNTENELTLPLEPKWTFYTEHNFSSAVMSDNIVFFESGNPKVLYGVNIYSGATLWSHQLQSENTHFSPSIDNNVIVTADHCTNCSVQGINSNSGSTLWSVSLPQGARESTVSDNTAFIGSDDWFVRAIDINSGNLLWTSPQLNDGITTAPAVADGKVFAGTWNSKLYALDAADGHKIWDYTVSSSQLVLFGSPTVANGKVYIAAGKNIYAVNTSNGSLVWKSPNLDNFVGISPSIVENKLFFISDSGTIYSLSADTGQINWTYSTNSPSGVPNWSSAAIANGIVYIGSGNGNLYAFDKDTGNVLWSYDLGGPIQASPVIANGLLYIGTENGVFYAFGTEGVLNVPYFSQNDLEWGQDEYDSASHYEWGEIYDTIDDWGCYMTSAAMILRYYGHTTLPDGTDLNPKIFNQWLVNRPNGEAPGYINEGWINPDAIARLTVLNQQKNNSLPLLDYLWRGKNDSLLKAEIDAGRPVILYIPTTRGHFVVAVGYTDDDIIIHDPEADHGYTFLSKYGSYSSMRTYTPTHSDLSYFMFIPSSNDVQFSLKDENGSTVPLETVMDDAITHQTIPNIQQPRIIVPGIPDPSSGHYSLEITSDNPGQYDLQLFLYNREAEVEILEATKFINQNPQTISFDFDKEADSQFTGTFAEFIEALDLMWEQGHISSEGTYQRMLTIATFGQNTPYRGISKYFAKNIIGSLKFLPTAVIDDYSRSYLLEKIQAVEANL